MYCFYVDEQVGIDEDYVIMVGVEILVGVIYQQGGVVLVLVLQGDCLVGVVWVFGDVDVGYSVQQIIQIYWLGEVEIFCID